MPTFTVYRKVDYGQFRNLVEDAQNYEADIQSNQTNINILQSNVAVVNDNISTLQSNAITRVFNLWGEQLNLEATSSAKIWTDLSFRTTNFMRLYKDYNPDPNPTPGVAVPRLFFNTDVESEANLYTNSIKTRNDNNLLSISNNDGTSPTLNLNLLTNNTVQAMLGNTVFFTMNNTTGTYGQATNFNLPIGVDTIRPLSTKVSIESALESEGDFYVDKIKPRLGNLLAFQNSAETSPILNFNFQTNNTVQAMLGNTVFFSMNNSSGQIATYFNEPIRTNEIKPFSGTDITISGNVIVDGNVKHTLKSVEITQPNGPYNITGYEYDLDNYYDYDVIIFKSNASGGIFRMNLPNPNDTGNERWKGREVLFKMVYHYNSSVTSEVRLQCDQNTGIDNIINSVGNHYVVMDRDKEWRRIFFSDISANVYLTGLRNY